MKNKYFFLFGLALVFVIISSLAFSFFHLKPPFKPHLKILTYSSFAGVYGPGQMIKTQFELVCRCKVQWFLVEDSTLLFQRFSLLSQIDLVIGWDQITLKGVEKDLWENLSFFKKKLNPTTKSFFQSDFFFPFDWAPIGFLYKGKKINIYSLKSLFEMEGKISFPEPRTSTLGLQFYYWIYEVFEADKKRIIKFLRNIKEKIYGPVFSWSMAYGLFQKGKTNMSLSYLSSLLYHHQNPKEEDYRFAYFEEGHPYQVEYMSVSKNSKNKALALRFAQFLLSEKIQNHILETNYMFSVSKKNFSHQLLKESSLQFLSYKKLDLFIKNKKELLDLWKKNLY